MTAELEILRVERNLRECSAQSPTEGNTCFSDIHMDSHWFHVWTLPSTLVIAAQCSHCSRKEFLFLHCTFGFRALVLVLLPRALLRGVDFNCPETALTL